MSALSAVAGHKLSSNAAAPCADSPQFTLDIALDKVVEANNLALKQTAAIIDLARAVIHGRSTYRNELPGMVNEVIATTKTMLLALCEIDRIGFGRDGWNCLERLDSISPTLIESANNLDLYFRAGYCNEEIPQHDVRLESAPETIRREFWRLTELLTKSSPQAERHQAVTLESIIREAHYAAARGMTSALWSGIKSYRYEQPTPAVQHIHGIDYFGGQDIQTLLRGPMGEVADTIGYFFRDRKYYQSRFVHMTLTDRAFQAHASMGHHQAFFGVIYDKGDKSYRVRWAMNEPAYGDGRIRYCAELFPKLGFKHSINGWSHCAECFVRAPKNLRRAVIAMFFASEELANLDISHAKYSVEERFAQFENYSRHMESMRGGCQDYPQPLIERYRTHLANYPHLSEREKRLAFLLITDPYPLSPLPLDGTSPVLRDAHLDTWLWRLRAGTYGFLSEWLEDLCPAGADIRTLAILCAETMQQLFAVSQFRLINEAYDAEGKHHHEERTLTEYPNGINSYHRGLMSGLKWQLACLVSAHQSGHHSELYIPSSVDSDTTLAIPVLKALLRHLN